MFINVSEKEFKIAITEELQDSEDSKFLEFLMKQLTTELKHWEAYNIDYNVQKKLHKVLSQNIKEIEADNG